MLIKIENQKGTEKPTSELGSRVGKASVKNFHIRSYFNDRFVYMGSLDRKLQKVIVWTIKLLSCSTNRPFGCGYTRRRKKMSFHYSSKLKPNLVHTNLSAPSSKDINRISTAQASASPS